MQGNSSVSIVGGIYREVCNACLDWDHYYGSGLRALRVLQELKTFDHLSFYSCSSKLKKVIPNIYKDDKTTYSIKDGIDVQFNYEHPFRMSTIKPRPDIIAANKQRLKVEDENVLVFGMIDADFEVNAGKAVYDPQTCVMPQRYSSTSKAGQLVYVLNFSEAKYMSHCDDIRDIRKFFFEKEGCYALIIKKGTKGAALYRGIDDEGISIPVYITDKVFTIGSGDIFTSYFAAQWFLTDDIEKSALEASKAVACYSSNRGDISKTVEGLRNFHYEPLNYREKWANISSRPFLYLCSKMVDK